MLTEETKHENTLKFVKMLSLLDIDLTDLSRYLDSINFYESPYSDKFYGVYPGALCAYSVNMFMEMWHLAHEYYGDRYSDKEIAAVALFREIYRAEMYEESTKNVKNEKTGQWETVSYYKLKENRPMYGDIGFSSFMIANRFVKLTDEQTEAIVHASAMEGNAIDVNDIMTRYPLVTVTKMAELAVKHIIVTK